MECNCLKEALLPLKESSRFAIADAEGDSFNDIKQYLHIKRDIENELLSLLIEASEANSKQLILICGSVGDGKSHLLSYLCNKHPQLLKKFAIHNDATESFRPTESNIDALNQLLSPFSDDNIDSGREKIILAIIFSLPESILSSEKGDNNIDSGREKIILAINLGTLSNFLAEGSNNHFKHFYNYVTEKKILEVGTVEENKFNSSNKFQFVNFCDHNLFYLTPDGPKSDLIEEAIKNIVEKNPDNPFYKAYLNHKEIHSKYCPIRFNYEFLQNPEIRKIISGLLTECIVKYQLIISIRSLYNFIYDLIVPSDLDSLDCSKKEQKIKNYQSSDFLNAIIPNYIFDHPERSAIFQFLHHCDPATNRSEKLDEVIIELVVSNQPARIFYKYIPREKLDERLQEWIDLEFKEKISMQERDTLKINSFIRMAFFISLNNIFFFEEKSYSEFMSYLYNYYKGKKINLKPLYDKVVKASMFWYGETDKDCINIEFGRQQLQYRFSKVVKVKPAPKDTLVISDSGEIVKRFEVSMNLEFKAEDGRITVPLNFRLYDFICKIDKGYRPTTLDHSDFAGFTQFIEEIAKVEKTNNKVFIYEPLINRKFELEFDDAFESYRFQEA